MFNSPKATVLMPVYNGAGYLREAVNSVLGQTFRDFELLILNDGSTDGSAAIVSSFSDTRIRLVDNGKNLGLIATLNRGIELAKGAYIARMDCDDISLPERLARQVDYLDQHPACAMVAVKVIMMSESGEECGVWNDDDNFTTGEEIRQRLPRANCIAHPGVMIRKEVLAAYGYDPEQISCEDYDLWLRMAADGVRMEKIDEYLLRYRLTPFSVTAQSNMGHPDLKNLRTKARFCFRRVREGKLDGFTLKVFCNAFKDLYYYLGKLFMGALTK